MPIQSIITDPRDGNVPRVDNTTGEAQGLVVATRPLKTYRHQLWWFTNDTYGADMNKNVTFAGTPDAVYTDNAQWTMSAITGTWDFDETTIKQGGTKAIDAASTINGSTAQAAKGGDLTVASYTALTGYMYITGWPATGTKGVEVIGWDTGDGAAVGVALDIADYVDTSVFGAWQQFAIPLPNFEFDATTIDALRFRTISLGAGAAPDYYLDTVQFEETGTPLLYTIRPNAGTWFHVNRIRMTIADNWVSTLQDASLPEISYDSILGVSALTSGLLYQRIQGGETAFTFPVRQVSDWMQMPGCIMPIAIGDATNTLIALEIPFEVPEILKAEDDDELRVTVQDNLSGLLLLRMVAAGFEETR
ncbi:MAG TPA: hypothetical protein VMV78_08775 [Thiobacillus sp.]|nr:hypothetical protein [Thiobacillus sp.]